MAVLLLTYTRRPQGIAVPIADGIYLVIPDVNSNSRPEEIVHAVKELIFCAPDERVQ